MSLSVFSLTMDHFASDNWYACLFMCSFHSSHTLVVSYLFDTSVILLVEEVLFAIEYPPWNIAINKSFTLNHHSTRCHRPCTLEWSWSDWPCRMICSQIKVFSFIPHCQQKLLTLLYQELHSSFTKYSFIESATTKKALYARNIVKIVFDAPVLDSL